MALNLSPSLDYEIRIWYLSQYVVYKQTQRGSLSGNPVLSLFTNNSPRAQLQLNSRKQISKREKTLNQGINLAESF